MDPTREPDLNNETGDRQIQLHLAEKGRDAVRTSRPRRFLDRHVQLLVEQAGANRRKADDEGNELQVP